MDVFLTHNEGSSGQTAQHDEFTGYAMRSVDLFYNTGIVGLEKDHGKAFATAAICNRRAGSNWVMPCFPDVNLADYNTLFGQNTLVGQTEPLKVGDHVRFGSTYAGGASQYCTILEKVPVTFLLNIDDDAASVEYRPGYGATDDTAIMNVDPKRGGLVLGAVHGGPVTTSGGPIVSYPSLSGSSIAQINSSGTFDATTVVTDAVGGVYTPTITIGNVQVTFRVAISDGNDTNYNGETDEHGGTYPSFQAGHQAGSVHSVLVMSQNSTTGAFVAVGNFITIPSTALGNTTVSNSTGNIIVRVDAVQSYPTATYYGVTPVNGTAEGTGVEVSVTFTSGSGTISVTTPGTGYATGHTLVIPDSQIGNLGFNDYTFTIGNVTTSHPFVRTAADCTPHQILSQANEATIGQANTFNNGGTYASSSRVGFQQHNGKLNALCHSTASAWASPGNGLTVTSASDNGAQINESTYDAHAPGSRFSSTSNATYDYFNDRYVLRDSDGNCGDTSPLHLSVPYAPGNFDIGGDPAPTANTWVGTDHINLRPNMPAGTLHVVYGHSNKKKWWTWTRVNETTWQLENNTSNHDPADAKEVFVGMYAYIYKTAGAEASTIQRARVIAVRGGFGNGASTEQSTTPVIEFDRPITGLTLDGTYDIINNVRVTFANVTTDSACYAYRINIQLNLSDTPNMRGSDITARTKIKQFNVHQGGIQMPGQLQIDTLDTARTLFDGHLNRSPYTTSTVSAKEQQVRTTPFLRSRMLDLEKCYAPMYRMIDYRSDKFSDEHPLRISFDSDTKTVARVTLKAYAIKGKMHVGKEDSAEVPDDDYVVLRFKELDGQLKSNNKNIDRAFGVLNLGGRSQVHETTGTQEYSEELQSNVIALDVQPPKKIQQLTAHVTDKNGNPAHFGRIHLWLKLETLRC